MASPGSPTRRICRKKATIAASFKVAKLRGKLREFREPATKNYPRESAVLSGRNRLESRLVILDRDGVINYDSDTYIRTADDWSPIPGSLESIGRLTQAGYRIVVASNQSGLGRGYFSIDAVNAVHRKMHRAIAQHGGLIEAIFFCPHAPYAGCLCRKPLPGLLWDIARRLNISVEGVPVIGDSLRDMLSARTVGASPMLVLTGNGKRTVTENSDQLAGVPVHENLASAISAILSV